MKIYAHDKTANWLEEFFISEEEQQKKVNAENTLPGMSKIQEIIMDSLNSLKKSKYATVEDALTDFRQRVGLNKLQASQAEKELLKAASVEKDILKNVKMTKVAFVKKYLPENYKFITAAKKELSLIANQLDRDNRKELAKEVDSVIKDLNHI